ncbi:hypothetical protein PPERSA_09011 [Pseudocohnilembus persalinus]|uniref:C2H2-type domain-containing protein n=1 Tax=Pseudocohnilembus persalinus TaxID=266149 RepID=A0A0V0R347_PSEPJ|nr:hypothetical protein PPERSA_09011 [Pseudocohnilembus persalinus]|eukprot:KRX08907.1 hypothetical protein PPERSA_09011 [Pseudocohnilembus persalinus]
MITEKFDSLNQIQASKIPSQTEEIDKEKEKTANKNENNENNLTQKQKKNFVCTFENCGKLFDSKSHFQRHQLTHTDKKIFNCTECQKSFKRKDQLKAHMNQHSQQKTFVCPFQNCQQEFTFKGSLDHHTRTKHTDSYQFQCKLEGCGGKFKTETEIKQHYKTKKHQKFEKLFADKYNVQYQTPTIKTQLEEKQIQDSKIENFLCQKKVKTEDNLLLSQNMNLLSSDLETISWEKESTQTPKINNINNQNSNKDDNNNNENIQNNFDYLEKSFDKLDNINNIKYEDQIEINANRSQILTGKDIFEWDDYQSQIIENIWNKNLQFQDIQEPDTTYGKLKTELTIVVGLVDKIQRVETENQEKIKTALNIIQKPEDSLFSFNSYKNNNNKQNGCINNNNNCLNQIFNQQNQINENNDLQISNFLNNNHNQNQNQQNNNSFNIDSIFGSGLSQDHYVLNDEQQKELLNQQNNIFEQQNCEFNQYLMEQKIQRESYEFNNENDDLNFDDFCQQLPENFQQQQEEQQQKQNQVQEQSQKQKQNKFLNYQEKNQVDINQNNKSQFSEKFSFFLNNQNEEQQIQNISNSFTEQMNIV